MSAATWIACSGAVIAARAAGGLFYINEHRPQPAPPRVELSCPASPAPVVNVAPAAAPVVQVTQAAPERPRVAAPAPARKKPAATARSKLKSKWSRPDE